MIYTESIRGFPYEPKEMIAKEFHISKGTVYNRLKEIDEEIKKGRYGEHAIARDGKIVLINTLVFLDYLTYRKRLRDKNARKYVPPFEPDKLVPMMGWTNRIIRIDEEGTA